MNSFYGWSTAVAMAGFLFGFDTIVISGADQQLQDIWQSSDVFHGFVVMAMALWGTVVGAAFGHLPTNKFGRKNTLIAIGVLFLSSAVGSALVNDPYTFAFFRFIGGLGVGASTIAAPAYLSEISPASKRGRLVAMYQLSIVLGILAALWSNYALQDMGDIAWRWMLGVEAIPALIYTLLIFYVPQSPRWLIQMGRIDEAKVILGQLNAKEQVDEIVNGLRIGEDESRESIFTQKYRRALMLVFLIAFFNQFSGINALLYYAPRIFEEAGLGRSTAFLSSVGVGGVNVLFTLLGMVLIDRLGRKQLLYLGSIGYIVSLSMVALSFLFNWGGMTVPIFLFIFIAAHAIGQGTVIWVFIAELFPNHLRASGQAFGSSVHWVLAALIPSAIPWLFSSVGPSFVFAIFAIMMVGQLLWVHFSMPETKGKSLEEVSRELMD